ncbi:efflux RND transporter permease subunit [Paraliomyxa miuraensis]|uniref:efflux RND transporter permease subunit n=1 Tax=Paraliomyxa miuraensis TaxID=376150 RepID=UPI002251A824|nr:efflux RND transporter permease subunit [Paraliomyxa miuraensis]MCX4247909.1 efflux RND transporter permease subunit [Paraliomyxa miuraensis]
MGSTEPEIEKGALAWMARNHVAANLLMFLMIVGGIFGVLGTKQEVFPEFDLDMITVSVPYPGAAPAEVEQGILLAIEERVRGLDGVKRIKSTAREGSGSVSVELLLDAEPDQVLADVKNEVDRITTFPEQAEQPTVSLAKRRRQVVSLILSGNQDLRALHELAEDARRGLLATGSITQVELEGVPPLEIAVEVPGEELQRYGLTLQQIANEISAASLELPGGGIDTTKGEILVRVSDRRRAGHELEDLVLRGTAKGGQVRLGDIATISDGYEDTDQYSLFGGHPAVRLTAYRVGDETPTQVSKAVRAYAEQLQQRLPEGLHVNVWNDDSEVLQARIDLLTRNATMGLVLVLVVLALFLDMRLAFWVSLGIPTSFLAAFLVLGGTDLSINMITLFAFIVTLGMVVDDAIVVGDRTYSLMDEGYTPRQAAVLAAREMAMPVTFSILTTVAAFAPLFFVPGTMGKVFYMIPTVVVAVLMLSLVESFLVLPAHLGHLRPTGTRLPRRGLLGLPGAVRRAVARGLAWTTDQVYRPLAALLIRYRYITFATSLAGFILTVGYVASGKIPFNFFPQLPGDLVIVQARLPYGAAIESTEQVRKELEDALDATIEEFGRQNVRGVFTRMGQAAPQQGPAAGDAQVGSHLVALEVALVPSQERSFDSEAFSARWQERVPPLPGIEALTFQSSVGPGAGQAVAVQLEHSDTELLAEISEHIVEVLREYPVLRNINNEYSSGKPQLDFRLRPEARSLGLSTNDIARQLRASFFGAEAIREQRGRNELRIMVRLPEQQRSSEHDLDTLMIRTPRGGEVPLHYVAELDRGRAATAIYREDGHRTITVSAELAVGVDSSREVITDLQKNVFPALLEANPGLEIGLAGAQREQAESFAALGKGFVFALIVIFGLLAVPLRSYIQPVIIMAVIPFGFIGAILGHVGLGYGLSIMSAMGLVALSGVVVNDSLVLIDAVNRERSHGKPAMQAIIDGAAGRIRAILLTSLTTFFGLVPMIAETSVQARFLIPMAISLAFGVMFSTFIVLLVVPALYMMIEDLRALFGMVDEHAVLPHQESGPPGWSPAQVGGAEAGPRLPPAE